MHVTVTLENSSTVRDGMQRPIHSENVANLVIRYVDHDPWIETCAVQIHDT